MYCLVSSFDPHTIGYNKSSVPNQIGLYLIHGNWEDQKVQYINSTYTVYTYKNCLLNVYLMYL